MGDKFLYITNDDKEDYPFCRLKFLVKSLETQLGTLGTSVINSPMSAILVNMNYWMKSLDIV